MSFATITETTIGINVTHNLANGQQKRRVYLDSAASGLMLDVAHQTIEALLPHYANTHTEAHFSAQLCSQEYKLAHQKVLQFVNAEPDIYFSAFIGHGATASMNHIARLLSEKRPDKDIVISTVMEHHSNDLPHRQYFDHVVHAPTTDSFGEIDISTLEAILKQFSGKVNYIAISGVSNVTGIINPINEIARLAHRYDAYIVVDAAQMAPHMPIDMHPDEDSALDIVCFSGHKMYCPGSPGVMIARKDIFSDNAPHEFGGGMVEDVYSNRYTLHPDLTTRYEAGTPNIIGAIALSSVLTLLTSIGMERVYKEEQNLYHRLLHGLSSLKGVTIYADIDLKTSPRIGALSFNIKDLHHGLTAAILNDYFNIAVRNGCFCAHPYVRELVTDEVENYIDNATTLPDNEELERITAETRGMVRASLGIYNTEQDIDEFLKAIKHIIENKDSYRQHYTQIDKNTFRHNTFSPTFSDTFSTEKLVQDWLNNQL